MVRRIKDFIRYTLSELENYTKCEGSCIKKINQILHLNFPPYGLGTFKATLLKLISEKKIGSYDTGLNGIILDIRNIKVLGSTGAIRFDDPTIHINIQCDCYVFQPKIGSVVQGLVKHISQRQIAVIIYRVFSVPIRLSEHIDKQTLKLNSEIEFRIKNFDLQNTMPYIEGELMCKEDTFIKNKLIKFDSDVEEDEHEDSDNDEKIFKKPKIPEKTACEIAAESENEEIVFSELRYLSNKEVKKLKKKKKHNSESNSSDTNDDTKPNLDTPKSILKKKISFVIDSDNSRNTSDSEKESSNKKSKKSKKNLITESPKSILNILKSEKESVSSSSSESDMENSQYLSKKQTNKDTTDNSTNKVKTEHESNLSISDSDSENDNISIKKENISVLNGIDYHNETFEPCVESIKKKISFANSSSSEDENEEPKASNNQSIINDIKSEIDSNSENENISIQSSRKTKKDITDDSDTNETPIKNSQANKIKIEQQSQEENVEIKTEFLTPIKNSSQKHNAIGENSLKLRNGYESEDLFEEYTQTQLKPNQTPNSSKKNKKERKNSLTNAMNEIVQKTKQKQSKLTDYIFQPTHSTQQTDSSTKSLSDSSFNNAFKDILKKSKKDKLSESENEIICGTPTEIFQNSKNLKNIQNNSNGIVNGEKVIKKKRKKSENFDFNSSMTEIIKRSLIEKKSKEEKLSQELKTNNAANDMETVNTEIAFKKIKLVKPKEINDSEKKDETEVKEKKKSRKRKISLNESMNNILAKVMKKKSKEITENTDTPPKKKIKLLQ